MPGPSLYVPDPPVAADALRVTVAALESSVPRFTDRPLFHVVLLNVSDEPLEVWAEDCSAGYGSVTLEVLALDERPLDPPIEVRRLQTVWTHNCIRSVALGPGEVAVRAVRLYNYGPGDREIPDWRLPDGEAYKGLPALDWNAHHIRLRAAFRSSPDFVRAERLWLGSAVSEARDYTIWGSYP